MTDSELVGACIVMAVCIVVLWRSVPAEYLLPVVIWRWLRSRKP